MLTEYRIIAQLLSVSCAADTPLAAEPDPGQELGPDCVDSEVVVSVNGSDGSEGNRSITLQSLLKYRRYRFRMAALTNAGEGDYTPWVYTHTLAGSTNMHTHTQS